MSRRSNAPSALFSSWNSVSLVSSRLTSSAPVVSIAAGHTHGAPPLPPRRLTEARLPYGPVEHPGRRRKLADQLPGLIGGDAVRHPAEQLCPAGQAVLPGDLEADAAPLGRGQRGPDQRQAVTLLVG